MSLVDRNSVTSLMLRSILATIVTIGLIVLLDQSWGSIPPLGRFLSPQHGIWQNAEAVTFDHGGTEQLKGLRGSVEIIFDDRLVPHVFASNDEDLIFAQGYLHARYRLFQMDLQTRAAAGEVSEFAGERAVRFDRQQRRLGMVFAAEAAVREIERDSVALLLFNAYTRGVNAYIDNLAPEHWPLEYKLLNIQPKSWSNLRTALLLKMMAKMLASDNNQDIAYTNLVGRLLPQELRLLYPEVHDSLVPIVPKGTTFPKPTVVPVRPAAADHARIGHSDIMSFSEIDQANENTGSNNWVVAGSRTKSGYPILCNDPHLELTLPSIWYEMQLSTPANSVYGATLPGSPFVIIGFNDAVAWGVTNSQRDVRDHYDIRFRDARRNEYWYDGRWEKTRIKVERIAVRAADDVIDTVAYTVFGPVMIDHTFTDSASLAKAVAVRWTAHDPSNEGMTFYRLNHARSYGDYLEAIKTFECPGQNFVFASHSGDIALWQQGKFPARWEGQGMSIMPGNDNTYAWQGYIPQEENPHVVNPERGFIESANQRPTDATYPYFIPGNYITSRAVAIERFLASMQNITTADMMKLQQDVTNVTAEDARPLLLTHVDEQRLDPAAKRYVQMFRMWNLQATPWSLGQTIYDRWWDSLQVALLDDELGLTQRRAPWPKEQSILEILLRDTTLSFIDNTNTPQRESLTDIVTLALNRASRSLADNERNKELTWSTWKNVTVYHLLRNAVPALARSGLAVGGDGNMINAVSHSHGPSWRMIVQMSNPVEAYGIYPGGQSGNPGSRFYDNTIDAWARGSYNRLNLMKHSEARKASRTWVLHLRGDV